LLLLGLFHMGATSSGESSLVLVTGCAGFIGSHLTDRLLERGYSVVGADNFSRGTRENLASANEHPEFQFVEADISDPAAVRQLFEGRKIETVWHMVANSDISAGVADPSIDLQDTFLSTFHLLEAMFEAGVRRLAFASSSAIYGVHDEVIRESTGPLLPISSYGAMKLASEAAISAAVERFLEHAWIFRFPNVIGSRATHGIIYDLLTKLRRGPADLEVLGDGTQQKPYLHVSELVDAMLWIYEHGAEAIDVFNIGPGDEGVTVKTIAEEVLRVAAPSVPIRFTGGKKGWAGDIPKFSYSIEKLRTLGWSPRMSSAEALERSVQEIYLEFQARRG
jgi:UDP-glucose 4-epimerase